MSWDDYAGKVSARFDELGYPITSIHTQKDPRRSIRKAKAIIIGGGNTWNLLKTLQDKRLLNPIRRAIAKGVPYIGWSAGSNITCPTIKTTNDMPVVEPKNFNALGFVPFQINPHYTDGQINGHGGETREERIMEFLEMNEDLYVVGLREGTMLQVKEGRIKLKGGKPARIFKNGIDPLELTSRDSLDFLLAK
jgi:dipeptidase E